jgi:hypothetical protein
MSRKAETDGGVQCGRSKPKNTGGLMKRGLLELFLFLFSQKESSQAISISK